MHGKLGPRASPPWDVIADDVPAARIAIVRQLAAPPAHDVALYAAAHNGHDAVVAALLVGRANVDLSTNDGFTQALTIQLRIEVSKFMDTLPPAARRGT